MITKIFTVLFAAAMVFTVTASAVQENFTLNFPAGNGTTTIITDSTVAQQQSETLILLIPVVIAIALAIGIIYVMYRRYKSGWF